MKYDNAKEIYEKVVTHGPLDIKVMIGNSHDDFNGIGATTIYDLYFKTPQFCKGIKMMLGAQDLLKNAFTPNGDKDKFFFDQCQTEYIEGMWFNIWSMSIER